MKHSIMFSDEGLYEREDREKPLSLQKSDAESQPAQEENKESFIEYLGQKDEEGEYGEEEEIKSSLDRRKGLFGEDGESSIQRDDEGIRKSILVKPPRRSSGVKESSQTLTVSAVSKSHAHAPLNPDDGSDIKDLMSFLNYYLGFMSGDLRDKKDSVQKLRLPVCEWNSDYVDAYIVDEDDSSSGLFGSLKEENVVIKLVANLKEL